MTHPGRFKIPSRNRAFDRYLDPAVRATRRIQRVIESLRTEIQDQATTVRARRIFDKPRELFRLEIENHEMGYLRTTVLDRPTLDRLRDDDAIEKRLEIKNR